MRTLLVTAAVLGLFSAHTARADEHERPSDWNVDWHLPVQTKPFLKWDEGVYSPLPQKGRVSYSSDSWSGTVDLMRVETGGAISEVNDSNTISYRLDGHYRSTLVGSKVELHQDRGDDDVGVHTEESIDNFAGIDAVADDLTTNQGSGIPGGNGGAFYGVKTEMNGRSVLRFCGALAAVATNAQFGLGLGAYAGVPLTLDWVNSRVTGSSPSPTVIPGMGGGWGATVSVSFQKLLDDPRYAVRCTGKQIAKLSAVQIDLAVLAVNQVRDAVRFVRNIPHVAFDRYPHPGAMGGTNVARWDDTLGADKRAAGGPSIAVGQTR